MGLAGGAPETIATSVNAWSLALDASHAYFTDGMSASVLRVPLTGGVLETLASDEMVSYGIAVDDSGIYWTVAFGAIMRAPLAGGPPVAIATTQNLPVAIALDETSIFWINNGDCTLNRLAK